MRVIAYTPVFHSAKSPFYVLPPLASHASPSATHPPSPPPLLTAKSRSTPASLRYNHPRRAPTATNEDAPPTNATRQHALLHAPPTEGSESSTPDSTCSPPPPPPSAPRERTCSC